MLIGYRCKVCGAPVDPKIGYCKYCNILNFKPIIRKPLKDDGKPRLIVRSGDKETELTPTKRVGYAHEFERFAQRIDQNIWISNDPMWRFDIASVRPVDFWNTRRIHNPVLEGMRCPICGADLDPEKSKCDYCGYWWIYSQDG